MVPRATPGVKELKKRPALSGKHSPETNVDKGGGRGTDPELSEIT